MRLARRKSLHSGVFLTRGVWRASAANCAAKQRHFRDNSAPSFSLMNARKSILGVHPMGFGRLVKLPNKREMKAPFFGRKSLALTRFLDT
jgi:hypothetical protein